ncbi:MAG: peptidase S8 [Flavobacteriaceae bacterium]|nr:MAG: peptidase S8 [Flavobacteriaceae bacterium]
MKKVLLLILSAYLVSCTAVKPQVDPSDNSQNPAQNKDAISVNQWFHSNLATEGIYGVADDAARAYLASKNITPKPLVVGVIDSGVDAEHQDLKANMWVNPKEVAGNNLDDDKNGYVDDVYGWNFIGNPNGENVKEDTFEITRLYVKYKAMFEGSNKYTNQKNIEKYPDQFKEYLELKPKYLKKYEEAKKGYEKFAGGQFEQMKAAFEGADSHFKGKKMTKENLASFNPTTLEGQAFKNWMEQLSNSPAAAELKQMTYEELKDEILGTPEYYNTEYNKHYSPDFDPRSIVGDNYQDQSEKFYGNNDVEGPDALHGTHVGGIISAVRSNGIGMDGIAGNHVKIMSIRAVPDGDERDKDVANAIRYAVDNGAKIINMSFGKGYSPYQSVVTDAILYATEKDVLLVHAAGNSDEDIDVEPNFPTNYKGLQEISPNWITVGASTRNNSELKASFSNFGKVQVDVFAPGLEIYSCIPDDQYKLLQGTSMASPVVAGVAALVWSHFPNLTAAQVKQILLESVNKGDADFQGLSKSGGVVDALKAVQLAEQMSQR